MPTATRRALRPGVEWEFDKLVLSREFSRNVVTRMLVERAEHGGWELARTGVYDDTHGCPAPCGGKLHSPMINYASTG